MEQRAWGRVRGPMLGRVWFGVLLVACLALGHAAVAQGQHDPGGYRRGGFFRPVVGSRGGNARPIRPGEVVALGAILVMAVALLPRRRSKLLEPTAAGWNHVDLVRVSLVVDEAAATRIGAHVELGRPRASRLARLVEALLAERAHWLFTSTDDYRPMSPPIAEAKFRALVGEVDEVDALSVQPGHAVRVTLVVASRKEITDNASHSAVATEQVLRALGRTPPGALVASEARLSPATDAAVFTAALPGLAEIGAMQGRVFCRACERPFAEQRATCPHCGQHAT